MRQEAPRTGGRGAGGVLIAHPARSGEPLWRSLERAVQDADGELGLTPAAVEAEHELVEAALRVLWG